MQGDVLDGELPFSFAGAGRGGRGARGQAPNGAKTLHLLFLGRSGRTGFRATLASSRLSFWACSATCAGTHSGKGVSTTTCLPLGVCDSRIAASRPGSNSLSSLTRYGQSRLSTYVTLPAANLQTRMSDELRATLVRRKISRCRGWAHQLPEIGPPATASARLGIAERADSVTIPWFSTNARAS